MGAIELPQLPPILMEWLRHPWAKMNIKTSPDYVDRTSHYENRAHALSWRSLVKIICFHRSFSIRFTDGDSSLSIVRGRAQQCNSSHDVSNSALKQGKFSKSHPLNYCQWGNEWFESNRIPMLCPKNSGIPRGREGQTLEVSRRKCTFASKEVYR